MNILNKLLFILLYFSKIFLHAYIPLIPFIYRSMNIHLKKFDLF